jgi:multidrug efflux pump subunit AcrA (membrane-fusion protein)
LHCRAEIEATAEAHGKNRAWRRRSEVRASRRRINTARQSDTVKTETCWRRSSTWPAVPALQGVGTRVTVAREGAAVRFARRHAERDFEGRIYHVGVTADPGTRQVEVMAWVKNPGVLKPGFFAEVTLATESHKGAIVVPEGAIQASEKGFVVYAVAEGKAQLRPIQIGQRTEDGVVEILSGLLGGESVVVEGSDRLRDGIEVQVADASSAGPAAPAQARSEQ